MKCGAYVRYGTRGKKKPKHVLLECFTLSHLVTGFKIEKPEDYEVCDGNVIPQLKLESDGGDCCCCCSYSIEMEYKCDKCGSTCFPELPRFLDEVNLFLKNHFTIEDRERYIAEYEKKEASRREQMATALAAFEKREAVRKKIGKKGK